MAKQATRSSRIELRHEDATATRIRVLHVTEAVGHGSLRSIELQMLNMPRARFDVEIAIPPPEMQPRGSDSSYVRRAEASGFAVHFVPMSRGILGLMRLPRAVVKLSNLIREGQYDIVHCHNAVAGVIGRLAATVAGFRPVIYQPHALPFNSFVNPASRLGYWIVELAMGQLTTRFIASSESEKAQVLAARLIQNSRIEVIEYPVDSESFEPNIMTSSTWRRSMSLPSNAILIGTTARHAPQKGLSYLMDAAAVVCREADNAYFVLAGDGPLRPDLERRARMHGIADKVLFLGHRSDIRNLLSAYDIFVLPSLWEALPYALIEAMLMRLPIVASAVAGCSDIIASSQTGLLVPPKDPDALASALLHLVFDVEDRRRLGLNAREAALARFSVSTSINKIVGLYSEIVGNGQHQRLVWR